MAEGFNILDGKVEVHLPRGTKPGKYMIACKLPCNAGNRT